MSRIERSLLLLFVGAAGVYLLGPAEWLPLFGHIVLFAAPAAGAWLAARAALRGARGAVPTWVLLSIAAAGAAIAQLLWAFRQLVVQQPIPFPSLTFYLFVLFHPLFAAALILSLRQGAGAGPRSGVIQDFVLATVAMALVMLRLVHEPLRTAQPWLNHVELGWILGGQFFAQLSFLAAILILIWRGSVLAPRATALVVAVAVVNAAATPLHLAGLNPSPTSPGHPFDLIWLAGWTLFVGAAAAGGSGSATAWTGRAATWISRRLRLVVAPIAGVTLTAMAVHIALEGGAFPLTLATLALLGLLMVTRLAGALGASEHEQHNRRELARTRVLVGLSRTLAAAPGVDAALHHAAGAAMQLLDGRHVWFERIESGSHVRVSVPGNEPARRVPSDLSCRHWLGDLRAAQALTGPDIRIAGPDGHPLPDRVWLAASAIRFGDRVAGTLAVTRDDRGFDDSELELLGALADQAAVAIENARLVEEARAAERTRLHSEKLAGLGQLAAGVAHELNNPLAAIHAAATTLAGERATEDHADVVQIIQTQAARAAAIVRRMLDFVRPPAVVIKPLDVAAMIRQLLAARADEHGRLGIESYIDLEGLPFVLADRGSLEQVFLNLFTNAEHALERQDGPRRLSVSGAADGPAVVVQVHDTGDGIPAENLGRVFDPFFTTKPVGEGTGLGLSVSYSIIRELGGVISVDSQPGQGTTFMLLLPAAEPAGETALPEAPIAPTRASPDPPTSLSILLVEDEVSIRKLVARYLRQRGHEVKTAENGQAALDALRERDFDAILTDLKMPVIDGTELYNRVLEANPAMAARILFISGDTVADETRDFLRDTGLPFMSKPFQLHELADSVERVARAGADPAA